MATLTHDGETREIHLDATALTAERVEHMPGYKTDHEPTPVAGYKPQSQQSIDLANEGKVLEERVLRYIEKVERYADTDPDLAQVGERKRFAAAGRTQMQLGWMMVIRAILNPGRVRLPDDPAGEV